MRSKDPQRPTFKGITDIFMEPTHVVPLEKCNTD